MLPVADPSLLLFLLFGAHFVADFGLQTQYMAVNKSSRSGNPDWRIVLFAHAFIHGFFVALLTGSPTLGALEVVAHSVLDELKSRQKTSYLADQTAHLLCKCAWWLLLPYVA